MIRVAIADDDDLMRAGLRMIVEQAEGLTVVAEAADGAEAVRVVREFTPDVILMDVRMPGTDGIEATRMLAAEGLTTRVLILTTFELDDYVFAALRAGASGFLLKRTPPEQLLDGLRTIHEGESLLSPSVTRRLIEHVAGRPAAIESDRRFDELTGREREVLVAMARGWSNSEISDRLFIAENTVKTHVKRILVKLRARDRVQAVVMAHEGGLMHDPS